MQQGRPTNTNICWLNKFLFAGWSATIILRDIAAPRRNIRDAAYSRLACFSMFYYSFCMVDISSVVCTKVCFYYFPFFLCSECPWGLSFFFQKLIVSLALAHFLQDSDPTPRGEPWNPRGWWEMVGGNREPVGDGGSGGCGAGDQLGGGGGISEIHGEKS